MIDKRVRSVAEALEGVQDGATVLCAGFAMVGEPHILLDGLVAQGAKDLTIVGPGSLDLSLKSAAGKASPG